MTGEIVDRLWKSFQGEDQRELAVQALTTVLQRAGLPVVPFGDEPQAEATKPAGSNQKGKGT